MGNKVYKDRMKREGRCVDCGGTVFEGKTRCFKHHNNMLAASKRRKREQNKGRHLTGQSNMRILILDIETSPTLAHVWKVWKENIGKDQVLEATQLISWAAKWHGEDEVIQHDMYNSTIGKMLYSLHYLLCQADAVVHYNGSRFDMPHINREFLEHFIGPPTPYKQIDLLNTVKRKFRFIRNTLDYVCGKLGIGKKIPHIGHQLWVNCVVHNDPKAWADMAEYNIQDVVLTEELYNKLLPWIPSHPNHNLYSDGTKELCPQCGSDKLIEAAPVPLTAGKYEGFKCGNCGRNVRGRTTILTKEQRANLNVGVHE